MWDIELEVVHIPGKHNKIADMLSRMDSHKAFEATINHLIKDPIWHQIDPSFFKSIMIFNLCSVFSLLQIHLPWPQPCCPELLIDRPKTWSSYKGMFITFMAFFNL